MSEFAKNLELELTPVPPDTISAGKEEVRSLVENALRESGQEHLLAEGQLQFNIEQTFPVDAVITVSITLLSRVAYDVFKEVILPVLKRRFVIEERLGPGTKKKS